MFGPAPPASVAFAAGQNGGNDHGAAEPGLRAGARGDDAAGDFVAERQRQRMVGAHAVVEIAEIGVADAASGDCDDDLARAGLRGERFSAERRVHRRHHPAVSLNSLCHGAFSALSLRGGPVAPRAAPVFGNLVRKYRIRQAAC